MKSHKFPHRNHTGKVFSNEKSFSLFLMFKGKISVVEEKIQKMSTSEISLSSSASEEARQNE